MPRRPLLPPGYVPRQPAKTALYQTLDGHLDEFIEFTELQGRTVPRFVVDNLRAVVKCGVLQEGFIRCWCPTCKDDLLVPFSCGQRGVCPSCAGRKMADTAAWLVDELIPNVPVRQFVISFPWDLRFMMAWDADLTSRAIGLFIDSVSRMYARLADLPGDGPVRTGSVTSIQRFDSSLGLDVHTHSLFLDGVYTRDERTGKLRFHPLRRLRERDVRELAEEVRNRIAALLKRRARKAQLLAAAPDDDEAVLAALYQSSVLHGTVTGQPIGRTRNPNLAQKPSTKGRKPAKAKTRKRLCADVDGFSLHAATRIKPNRRGDLERIAKYILRPALSHDRLRLLDDESVVLELPRPRKDGTTELVFAPVDFIARLAALVPPPGRNQILYHGVFAPAAPWRAEITATTRPRARGRHLRPRKHRKKGRRRPLDWASLLERSLDIRVLICRRCGGTREVLATITDPHVAHTILTHLDIHPFEPPPKPGRSPPDPEPWLSPP